MIFCTQIRRSTEPGRLAPVVVSIDYIHATFESPPSTNCQVFEVRLKVEADTNADGIPDAGCTPWSYWEMDQKLFAGAGELSVVDNRLRGSGNLMAGIRLYARARVRANNEAVSPGDTEETYDDIDTDIP